MGLRTYHRAQVHTREEFTAWAPWRPVEPTDVRFPKDSRRNFNQRGNSACDTLVLSSPRLRAAMRLLAWRRDRRWVRRLRSGFLLQHFTPLRSKRNRPIRWRQRSPSPTMTRHCVRRTHQHHTAPLQQSNPLQPVSRAGEVIELACRLLRREMSQVAKRRSAALSASPPLPGARRTFKGALASSDSLLANHASWTFVPANDS